MKRLTFDEENEPDLSKQVASLSHTLDIDDKGNKGNTSKKPKNKRGRSRP